MNDALDNRLKETSERLTRPDLAPGGWTDVVQRATDMRTVPSVPRQRRPWLRLAVPVVGVIVAAIVAAAVVRRQSSPPLAQGPLTSIEYTYTNTGTFAGTHTTSTSRHEIDYARKVARITDLTADSRLPATATVQIVTEPATYLAVPDARRSLTRGKAWIRVTQPTDWQAAYGQYTAEFERPLSLLTQQLRAAKTAPTTIGREVVDGRDTTHLRGAQTTDGVTEVTDLWIDPSGYLVHRRLTRTGADQTEPQIEEIRVLRRNDLPPITVPADSDTFAVASSDQAAQVLSPTETGSAEQQQTARAQVEPQLAAFLASWSSDGYAAAAATHLTQGMQPSAGQSLPVLRSGRVTASTFTKWTSENDFVMQVGFDLQLDTPGLGWIDGRNDRVVHFQRNEPGQGFTMDITPVP